MPLRFELERLYQWNRTEQTSNVSPNGFYLESMRKHGFEAGEIHTQKPLPNRFPLASNLKLFFDLRAIEDVGSKDVFTTSGNRGTLVPAFMAKQQCGANGRRHHMFDLATGIT